MGQRLVIIISTVILLITGVLLGYVLSQLIQGILAVNLVTFLGTFSLIVIFGTLYYVLFWEFRRTPTQTLPSQRPSPASNRVDDFDSAPNYGANYESHYETNQELSSNLAILKERLIRLLDGDGERAERLVQIIRDRKPGMEETWYWQQVITQWEERDRFI